VIARWEPVRRLRGSLRPPPDKSISHRAALLAAMHAEPVRVHNYLDAADTNATLQALRAVGVLVEQRPDELLIRGPGLRSAVAPAEPIDVGNAGTLMRLLPGWLAANEGQRFTLDGDASIRQRPVDRIAKPLRLMGAGVQASRRRYPPFTITGARLRAIDYALPVASAQVKSCVLIAALGAEGATVVTEPLPSRDHTERMLSRAGADVSVAGPRICVSTVDELGLEEISVPGDASSAAFLIAAGLLVAGSRIVIEEVGVNRTRTGFLRILRRMGAIIEGDLEPELAARGPDTTAAAPPDADEPIAELDIANGPLVGTEVSPEEVPLAIDELPLVALVGCFADGETVVRGAGELRIKESDRIGAVVAGLRGLGGDVEEIDDGFRVQGTGGLRGGRLDSRGDHRLAMLGAVAGLASDEGVEVVGMEAAGVSYPAFADDLRALIS